MSTWLEVIFVLALMAAAYGFGKFEGVLKGQASTLAFLEQSLKGIIKTLMREIRHEDSEEELL